jgi:hypothetical protein
MTHASPLPQCAMEAIVKLRKLAAGARQEDERRKQRHQSPRHCTEEAWQASPQSALNNTLNPIEVYRPPSIHPSAPVKTSIAPINEDNQNLYSQKSDAIESALTCCKELIALNSMPNCPAASSVESVHAFPACYARCCQKCRFSLACSNSNTGSP